ncbi:MAG: DUF368 domain-containing protein [Thermoplasmata archaeon]|nr:DUF368 domain-containing protein [Thermoplasmata archaeon]
MKAAEAVKNVVVGTLIGIFMMLPGASGATMAVIFGVYERLIRDVSKLTKYLISDLPFIITIGIGGVIGFLICAKGLDALIDSYAIPAMFFFAALITVQIPDLKKNVDEEGGKLTTHNILAMVGGFAVMMVVLFMSTVDGIEDVEYGTAGMLIAGLLYAICALSPGISGSTILLTLGLLTPVLEAVTEFKLMSILPLLIGAIVGVLCFSKIINHFMTHNRRSTYCAILGLTVGSIVTVVAQAFMEMEAGKDYLLPCIIAIAGGLAIGWCLHLFTRRFASTEEV